MNIKVETITKGTLTINPGHLTPEEATTIEVNILGGAKITNIDIDSKGYVVVLLEHHKEESK